MHFFFLSYRLFCNGKKYHPSFMSLYIILFAEYWASSGLQIFKVSVMSNRDINPDTLNTQCICVSLLDSWSCRNDEVPQ